MAAGPAKLKVKATRKAKRKLRKVDSLTARLTTAVRTQATGVRLVQRRVAGGRRRRPSRAARQVS